MAWQQPVYAAESPVLRIGTMNLPPYGWIDKQGKPHGIVYALNQEIGIRSGMAFTNKIYPFNRLLTMLKNGELDLISSQAHQPALDAGDRLTVQLTINVIAATRKGSAIRSIKDFKDAFLVYHHAATYPQLDGLAKHIQRVKSYRQALKILHDRPIIDGAVFSEPAYYYWMRDLGLSPEDFGRVIMIEKNKKQWIFVRKDLPKELRDQLRQVIQEINEENLYKQLLQDILQ
jgi:ABC-type amino acid transport substrate-binding protein